MSVNLIPNANALIEKRLHEKTNAALYKMIVNAVNNRFETEFASQMQNYVQRIGHLISDHAVSPKMGINTYLGSVEYLGKILENNNLRNMLKYIEINDAANAIKHSTRNVEVDIEECLHQYNRLINEIVNKLKLPAFKICHIEFRHVSSIENQRNKPVFSDTDSIKYIKIDDFKLSVSLGKTCKIDNYSKTMTVTVNFKWPDDLLDHFLSVVAADPKRGHEFGKKIITTDGTIRSFDVEIPESYIDRRKVTISVIITLYKDNSYYRTVGHLWNKRQELVESHEEKSTVKVLLSQLYIN